MQLQGMLKHKMAWAEARGPHHEVVLSSRVRLARNLAGAAFPSHASTPALKFVLERVFDAARQSPLKGAAYLKLWELEGVDRGLLIERHLISPVLAGEPVQRGVVVTPNETISLMVNEEDHIRLAALQPGLSLRQAWRDAEELDEALEWRLDIAFRKELGYLTACPTNLGTALRASCLVHLPGLGMAGRINGLLEQLPRHGLIARGLYGEGTKVMGDFFQISNATGLGRTEAEILTAIEAAVSRLAEAELSARKTLDRRRLEDVVYRALGTLQNARMLSFAEACQCLSALRVGLTMGWNLPGDMETINELAILTQPAHVTMLAGKPLGASDMDSARATLVRGKLR
jgi:protein arginine kinase